MWGTSSPTDWSLSLDPDANSATDKVMAAVAAATKQGVHAARGAALLEDPDRLRNGEMAGPSASQSTSQNPYEHMPYHESLAEQERIQNELTKLRDKLQACGLFDLNSLGDMYGARMNALETQEWQIKYHLEQLTARVAHPRGVHGGGADTASRKDGG